MGKKNKLFMRTMSVLRRKKICLILIFIFFSCHLRAQYGGGLMVTLGSPINQKIEHNSILYDTGGYSPDFEISGFGFRDEDHYFGWGFGMNIFTLDIRNLPGEVRVNNKQKHTICGFYTGPTLKLFWSYHSSVYMVINAQIGFIATNVAAVQQSTPKTGFGIKTSADLILGPFSIGVTYRPLELLMGEEYSSGSYFSSNYSGEVYTLKPAFELRVSCFVRFK